MKTITDQPGSRRVAPKDQHRLKQRFEVKKKLGQGTYGKVQLAINKETGQEVAIKTIKKSKIETEQDLVRIRREIQIMSSIQHPHIIHIYEVFENKQKIVLVMQFASGGELYEYVSDRKVLSDSEARRLFRQIATAVYYCHKNKVCHRDLKLENILLDEKGNAKIGDFGLSNVFDDKHFLSTFCGSPLYASPEIVRGIPYYGAEVDCWSLGVLLYTLVYGAMPFDGSNFKKLVKQISEANYYEPKQKSEASNLIRKLLSVDPAKRATIIDICNDRWVNKGYEHSLLQVADDLANLTPVRLDVLLALAPISPNAEPVDQHPLAKEVTKKKKAKPKIEDTREEMLNQALPMSTDMPTYPEEEEEGLEAQIGTNEVKQFPISDRGEDFNKTVPVECAAKRVASASFDNSASQIPSHVVKKKKPRQNACEQKPTIDKNANSGHKNETNTSIDARNTVEVPKPIAVEAPSLSKVSKEQHAKDANLSVSSQASSLPPETSEIASTSTLHEIPSNTSVDAIKSFREKVEPPFSDSSSSGKVAKESTKLPKSADMKPSEVEKTKTHENKALTGEKTWQESEEGLPKASKSKVTVASSESFQPASRKDEDKVDLKNAEQPKISSMVPGTGPTPQISDDVKNKPWLERGDSVNRKVGKITYPKFLENAPAPEKKPVPKYGKISEAKKLFQTRQNSIDKEKERVIPMVKVSDAKKVFERRASMPAVGLTNRCVTERKSSLSTPGPAEGMLLESGTYEYNSSAKRPTVPPIKTQMSESPENCLSDEATKEREGSEKLQDNSEKSETSQEVLNSDAGSETPKSSSISVFPIDEEEKKRKAKDVIKKNIAKVKLQELRQSSIESNESNSSNKTGTCQSPDVKPKSYARTPKPFRKEELKSAPVKSVAEIKLTPKPKLKLDTEAARRSKEDSLANRIESASVNEIVSETLQPCTPSQTPYKAAPITRSYKKVTFTKDGACITETGKIIKEEGADGSFTRLEKKSKVTHYPTGKSSTTTKSESSEETRTVRSFGHGSQDDVWQADSISPPLNRAISGGLNHSESESSSGSIDIFDDIFDTWSGDPVFNNLSGRMRSMLSSRSPFSTLWGSKKRSKPKSRAESCERKPLAESESIWRRSDHGTDQECSDTDTDTETNMSSSGLWKLLGNTPNSKSIFDRHRSIFSRKFDDDDFFSKGSTFGSLTRRSLSRERPSSSSFAPNTSSPTVRVVINPLSGSISRRSGSALGPEKQDSLDSNESNQENWSKFGRESRSSKASGKDFTKGVIHSVSAGSPREEASKPDSEEGISSRRRVEQWLDMTPNEVFDRNHPISMYTTLRPRNFNRYGRSVSSRYGVHPTESESSLRDETGIPESENNQSFSTTREINVHDSDENLKASRQSTRKEVIIPVARSESDRSKPVIHMKLSIGRPGVSTKSGEYSDMPHSDLVGSLPNTATNTQPSTPDLASDWPSPLVLPESSSLLEQLRTHGYRNLVSQRLSGVSSSGERSENLEPSTSSSGLEKRENGAWKCHSNDGVSIRLRKGNCMTTNSTNTYIETESAVNTARGRTDRNDTSSPSIESKCNENQRPSQTSLYFSSYLKNNHSLNNNPGLVSYSSPNLVPHFSTSTAIKNSQSNATSFHPSPSTGGQNLSNKTLNVQDDTLPVNVDHVHENDVEDESNRGSNSTHRSVSFDSSPYKETVQERILRKSYYSRFNHPSELRRSSSLRRRASLTESDSRFWDSPLNDTDSSFGNHDSIFRQYKTKSPAPISSSHNLHSKPPIVVSNDKFFERVQIRAQKLIDEAKERHANLLKYTQF